jgi:chemotaxis protein methyltransferase CheR
MPSQGKHIETNIPLGFTPDELQSFHKFMERQFRFRLRWYNSQSAERRLKKVIKAFGLRSLTDLEQRLISCDYSFQDFVSEFTVNVTEIFREPKSLEALVSNVMPFFKRSQKIKVLIVGCSTGEELASICILLKENMMLERSEILATDIDEAALQKAKNPSIKRYDKSSNNKRYKIACGQADLDNYFSGVGSFSFLNESLLKTVSYKKFDLCSDNLQDQFDIIFCRNVLIYFQYQEQHQLIDNLSRHLKPQGFLALGEKETIIHMKNLKDAFAIVSGEQNIYRKLNK